MAAENSAFFIKAITFLNILTYKKLIFHYSTYFTVLLVLHSDMVSI